MSVSGKALKFVREARKEGVETCHRDDLIDALAELVVQLAAEVHDLKRAVESNQQDIRSVRAKQR